MEMVKNPDGKVTVKVKAEGEVWEKAKKKAFNAEKRKLSLPGFRKGQVPDQMAKRYINMQNVIEAAVKETTQTMFMQVVEDEAIHNMTMLEQPAVKVLSVTEDGAEFAYIFVGEPEAVVSSYKELGVEKPVVEVTDEDVAANVNATLARNADWELIEDETPAKLGDRIKAVFKESGEHEDNEPEEITVIIGENRIYPEFEQKLIGFKTGETKTITITYPENFMSEDLAGKETSYDVTVNEIYTKDVPELTDENAAELEIPEVKTVEELQNKIREVLTANMERQAEEAYTQALLNALVKNTEVDVPNVMIDKEVENVLNNYDGRLRSSGYSLSEYLESTGQSPEALKETLRAQAENDVKAVLALRAVLKDAGLEVSDDEVTAFINSYVEGSNLSAEDVAKLFNRQTVKDNMERQKALDYLKSVQ